MGGGIFDGTEHWSKHWEEGTEKQDIKLYPEKKYKIIGMSNFCLDYVDDFLIADNLNEYYGKMIEKFLQDNMHEHDTYYPRLVEQDYELYKWEP